jgi:predicted peptidase
MLSEDVVQRFQVGEFQPAEGPRRGEVFQYRLLTPRQIVPGLKYPLIVFLHGAGERGTDNVQQLVHFPELMASDEHREKYPCFVFAPQCLPEYRWVEVPWDAVNSSPFGPAGQQMQLVLGMLDQIEARQPVDLRRVYLTGLSMGGYGCWDLAARFPRRFAAVAPICGGGDESQAARLTTLPIWAFHGELDDAVPVERSRRMIAAIRAAGGSPRYSELAGVGHHSWTPAYADSAGVIPWMFEQTELTAG